jgi:hypothetical protein
VAAGWWGPLDAALSASAQGAGLAYGLVQEFAAPELPTLYDMPSLLRPWLAQRLSAEEVPGLHARLASFWRQSYEAN